MTDLPTIIAKMPTAEKITADWGERCPDHDGDCFCCQMWAAHDAVAALLSRIEELERERDEIAEHHRAEICDMSERFRAVNLSAVIDKMPMETKRLLDRATTAEAKLAEAVKVIEQQSAALSPLSDAVFNDNGDMTVNIPYPEAEECTQAYFADRAARSFLQSMKGK